MLSQIQDILPILPRPLELSQRVGLIIIDEIVGFAQTGGGNLAPQHPNAQVEEMVRETNRLAKSFSNLKWPILAFRDCHIPGKAEAPYPPHCEKGTGEEEFVPELKWLEKDPQTTIIDKDCINGFIGAQNDLGINLFVDWVKQKNLNEILVVGICTDICVMDFVLTSLSARNHGLLGNLKDIHVYERACATYDLPKEIVQKQKLPITATHPQNVTHHVGLYFMASRGANIVSEVTLPNLR